jgi:hypothetical protein
VIVLDVHPQLETTDRRVSPKLSGQPPRPCVQSQQQPSWSIEEVTEA